MLGEIWDSFYINNKRHCFTYDDKKDVFKFEDREYFNTNTDSIIIYNGVECNEYGQILPKNTEVICIYVIYIIKNYSGDKSGMH